MGTALIKLKIMPNSPEADLDKIQQQAEDIIKQEEGKTHQTEREPIAFGLNAIIITFAIDESIPTDPFIEKIQASEQVSSAEIIDFRRALG